MSFVDKTGDGSVGLYRVPSTREEFTDAEMFLDSLSWAETCLVEEFKTESGITVTGSHHILPNQGVKMNASGVTIQSVAYSDVNATDVGVTIAAAGNNTGGSADPVPVFTAYDENFPETYTIDITTAGAYGAATCSVIRQSDNTTIVSNVTISQNTVIDVENDIDFKWTAAGQSFDLGDTWTIEASTGNIKYILADIKPANAQIKLEVSLNGTHWIELTHFNQKAEEEDWNEDYSGKDLTWRIEALSSTLITHLFIATGDHIILNNWPSATSS